MANAPPNECWDASVPEAARPGNRTGPARGADAAGKPAYLIVLPWELTYAGGVNEVVRNLLRCLSADRTWNPALLVSSWAHRRPAVEQDDGLVTIRTRLQNPVWHLGSVVKMLKAAVAMPRSLRHLYTILSRHRVDIVNLQYVNPDVWNFIVLRPLLRPRFRLILSFHGMDIEGIRNCSPVGRWLWRRALARCDGLVCCSHALARELEQVEPAVRGRLTVIHNGIDPRAVSDELATASLPDALEARRYLACVATFDHKKGLDVLVKAFRRLAAALPGMDLVLAGRSNGEEPAIRSLVEQLDLRNRVHLMTDMPHAVTLRIIANARAFVLASRREPFGIVLLEAGLLGIPIVATSVGGIREVVRDGQTGRLVPAEDEAALAQAISETLRDDISSRRMAEAMRARVLAEFSWDAAFSKYRALALGGAA